MKKPICKVVSDGKDMFVYFSGKRIAKRGHPRTSQAGIWVSLEPGYEVISPPDHSYLAVKKDGVRVH